MFVASTFFAGPVNTDKRGSRSGSILTVNPGAAVVVKTVDFPVYVTAVNRRPSQGNYGNRQYLVGGHTANLLVDEELRCLRQSIDAPDVAPTVSSGAGTTSQIGYQRFYDEVTDEMSPLSAGTTFTGDLNRAWSNLSTEVPSERFTVEGVCQITAGVVNCADRKSNYANLRPGDRIAVSTDLTKWYTVRSVTNWFTMTLDDTTVATGAGVSLVAKIYSRVSHIEIWLSESLRLPASSPCPGATSTCSTTIASSSPASTAIATPSTSARSDSPSVTRA
jgi:hypothetical protein